MSAFIPPQYIADDYQKIEVYKRIAAIESREEAKRPSKPNSKTGSGNSRRACAICLTSPAPWHPPEDRYVPVQGRVRAVPVPRERGARAPELMRVLERFRSIATLSATQPPQISLRRKSLQVREMLELSRKFALELIDCEQVAEPV